MEKTQQEYRYNPLLGKHDIRVIQLLTPADDPAHETGPVHCKIVHVSLDGSGKSRSESKGSSGSWSLNDVNAEPEPQPSDFDELFERSSLARISPFSRIPELPYLQKPEFLEKNGSKAKAQISGPSQDHYQEAEADLPWRYDWGDFVALSYVWGDPSLRGEVYVDDIPVSVTANLEWALRELRNHSRIQQGFLVWVDALCINQADLDERSAQVGRMKDIYQTAWHVVTWLGPEGNHSDLGMLALRYISLHADQSDVLSTLYRDVNLTVETSFMRWVHNHTVLNIRKAALCAIYHLLARPYWRRLWIIQELVLGTGNSPVLCGGSSVLLKQIFAALNVMQANGGELGRYTIFAAKGTSNTREKWGIVAEEAYEISEQLWERPISIIALKSLGSDFKDVKTGLYDTLLVSREASATDERDRVYGILGLPHIANTITLVPDYNRKAPETYTLFSERLVESGQLNGLRLINSPIPSIGTQYWKNRRFSRPRAPRFVRDHRVVHHGCNHDFPSWVVCWSCPRSPAQPLPTSPIPILVSPTTKPQVVESKLLTVEGIIFDTITTLSSFHATESDKSYPHSTPNPPKSPYGSRDATRKALAYTLTGHSNSSPDSNSEDLHVLHPMLWAPGTIDVDNGIFGLQNFFHRNRALQLFSDVDSQTLESLIFEGGKFKNLRSGPAVRLTQVHREMQAAATRRLAWRRLFATRGGYLGLAPAAAEVGDVVAVLSGCDAPLVLRPVVDGLGNVETERYRVVGEAYVHWGEGDGHGEQLVKSICII